MQALGLIETKGLILAIEAADTMVKSADVSIVQKTYVGGGLVTILVTGDVGAVKASIEAGVAAVKKLDERFLISHHVIPSPHEELESIIGNNKELQSVEVSDSNCKIEDKDNIENKEISNIEDIENVDNLNKIEEINKEETENNDKKENDIANDEIDKLNKLEDLHKEDIDSLVKKNGIDKTVVILAKLKVIKLRNLAREYDDFVITGRTISKASKNVLITKFKLYYEKN